MAELTARSQAQPTPGEFDHQPAASPVTRRADTQFHLAGAAGVGGGRHAEGAGQFPAVEKLPPAGQFPDQGPRAAGAKPASRASNAMAGCAPLRTSLSCCNSSRRICWRSSA